MEKNLGRQVSVPDSTLKPSLGAWANPCEQRLEFPPLPTHLDSASCEKFLHAPLTQIFGGKNSPFINIGWFGKKYLWHWTFFSPSTVMSFEILVVLQIGYFYFPPVTFLGNTFVWISYVLSDPCNLIHSISFIFSAMITNVMQPQTREPSFDHFQTCSFWISCQSFYSQIQRKIK